MADVAQKCINANNVNFNTITVRRHGGKNSAFDYDTVGQEVNPNGETPSEWEAKLTGRFDEPRYYAGDTSS